MHNVKINKLTIVKSGLFYAYEINERICYRLFFLNNLKWPYQIQLRQAGRHKY